MRAKMFGTVSAITALVGLLLHCNTSFDQCATDSECDHILGTTAGASVCNAGTCLAKNAPVAAGDDASTAPPCNTNDDCVQKNNGAPSLCLTPKTASCVQLTSDECPTVSANWKNTVPGVPPLLIGTLLAPHIKYGDGSLKASNYDGVDGDIIKLASEEWDARTGGGLVVKGTKQPLVYIGCETQLDKTVGTTALAHLQQIGTKALVVRSPVDLDNFGLQAVANKQMVICSDCFAGTMPAQQAAGLVWYLLPTVQGIGKTSALGGMAIETLLRSGSPYALNTAGTFKVASVANGIGVVQTIADEIESSLVINGQPVKGDGGLSPAYVRINTPDFRQEAPNYDAIAQQIVDFLPDVIFTNVASDLGIQLMPKIESKWPASAAHKPYYVTGNDDTFSLTDPGFLPFKNRILGFRILPPDDAQMKANHDAFIADFKGRFSYDPTPVDSGYDAMYAASYVYAATVTRSTVSVDAMTGADLAASFSRLRPSPGGTPVKINVLPGEIANGVSALSAGQGLDLLGIADSLDWDLTNGSVPQKLELDCIDSGGTQNTFKPSGIGTPDGTTYTTTLDKAGCGF